MLNSSFHQAIFVWLQNIITFPSLKMMKILFILSISQSIYLAWNFDLYPEVVLGMC